MLPHGELLQFAGNQCYGGGQAGLGVQHLTEGGVCKRGEVHDTGVGMADPLSVVSPQGPPGGGGPPGTPIMPSPAGTSLSSPPSLGSPPHGLLPVPRDPPILGLCHRTRTTPAQLAITNLCSFCFSGGASSMVCSASGWDLGMFLYTPVSPYGFGWGGSEYCMAGN